MDLGTTEQMMRFSLLANLAGVPSISFPAGQLPDGRPVGMMMTADWWEEHLLLRMAHAAEATRPRLKRPVRWVGDEVGWEVAER